MKIKIRKSDVEKIYNWAIEGLPNESGGLVITRKSAADSDTVEIVEVRSNQNYKPSGAFFQLHPVEFIEAYDSLNNNPESELELRGFWHSHIFLGAYPSGIDLQTFQHEGFIYPIIGIRPNSGDYGFNVFTRKNGEIIKCDLEII